MSALAMILTAAMMVPGDGPEKVSGEIAKPQRLDLSGEWGGTVDDGRTTSDMLLLPSREIACIGQAGSAVSFVCSDRGHGGVDVKWGGESFLGTYRQRGDSVLICFSTLSRGRPTSFRSGNGHILFTLHRIKSLK